MLTRRHIRVKVMQSVYALHQEENHNLQRQEKFLVSSMENMQGLYAALMGLWVELHNKSQELIALSKNKYIPTEKDKLPNQKFIENKALRLLVSDEKLLDFITNENPVNWHLHSEYVGILHKEITESELYSNYIFAEKNDFESDKLFLVNIFENYIVTNEKLYDFLQDFVMTWSDDFPIVNTLILKKIKNLKPKNHPAYLCPKLYKDTSDKDFALELLQKAVLNDEKYHQYLVENTENWEVNRLAQLDAIMIKMAITEFLKFPSIPVRVTLNEYLEISKEYSSPKSSIFINGVLDKISKKLDSEQLIQKVGRGLY